MKKTLLMLALMLPVLFSCTETFSPTIKITPSLSYVPYEGGSVDITVMTDLPWKVVLDDEDVTTLVSKSAGIGDDVVTLTIPETDSWTTSSVSVKFYCTSNSASGTKTAVITQGYKPYISVEGESLQVPSEGGDIRVVVTSNTPWKAVCDTPGVSVSPDSDAAGNRTVRIITGANTTGAERKITVDFVTDGDSASFEFTQL